MKLLSARYVLPLLVVLVLALPFAFRAATVDVGLKSERALSNTGAADSLVIITPNLEAVRRKFGNAFSKWYARKFHRKPGLGRPEEPFEH